MWTKMFPGKEAFIEKELSKASVKKFELKKIVKTFMRFFFQLLWKIIQTSDNFYVDNSC